jgi:hypothetical protein
MKDLDKSSQELNQLREQKEKLEQELQVGVVKPFLCWGVTVSGQTRDPGFVTE